jgi:hypothetical protein
MHSKRVRVSAPTPALVVAAAVAAFASALVPPASAAVRRCHALQSSEIVTATKELQAKKKATDQWRAKALTFGPGFDSWRLAHLKALTCFKKAAGFECIAAGAPCIVDQTPATPLTPPVNKGPSI